MPHITNPSDKFANHSVPCSIICQTPILSIWDLVDLVGEMEKFL